MRTTDFSRAPKQGRAAATVVVEFTDARRQKTSSGAGAGSGGGGRGRLALELDLSAIFSRQPPEPTLTEMPGYVWHRSYRRNNVSGVIVFFDSVEHAEDYSERIGRASATSRLLVAEPNGYSNGVWRAEANTMSHIERFSPTSAEVVEGRTPPAVAGSRGAAGGAPPSSSTAGGPPSSTSAGSSRDRARRPVTDARAMFIGATRYRGPLALVTLSRTWYPMIARLRRMPGYSWHLVYWQAPFILGTIAFFDTRDDLLSFARNPAHRRLMQWITEGTKHGTGGYIRLHVAATTADGAGDDLLPPDPFAGLPGDAENP